MEENNYTRHFDKELKIIKDRCNDDAIIEKFEKPIRDIIEITSKQGHSGTSAHWYANYLSSAIKNILLFQPLSPIMCTDNEWMEVGGNVFQNIRCGSVFKDGKDEKPHYLDAIVWKGEDEYDTFTGSVGEVSSRQYIKIPFTPKTFYIDVKKVLIDKEQMNECDYFNDGKGNYYTYEIKDRKQLDEVFKYYEKKEVLE